ncbi:MAG: tyrosine--tRNA ligase [Actinomycetota bacterium]
MSGPPDVSRQLEVLLSGTAEVVPVEELEEKLTRSARDGKPLRVKLGIDPSAPDLHLGHAVVLRKLRRFQDFGHIAVLIVGDFTGRVGDPTGRSETRPMLSPEELEANARTYLDQVGTVLDMSSAEVRRNSEWLAPQTFADVARLASPLTVARLLERDDFSERYKEGKAISLVEFLYPLMQGFDSVAVESDVEMGGSDQLFNLLVGRDIQRSHDIQPQVAFTMPLLAGTDGDRKMSKSFGNHIGLTEPPEEQFGKTMSIPDQLIVEWFRLCTDLDPSEIHRIETGLTEGTLHPAEQKRRLAREIVGLYHGEEAALGAEARFDAVFKRDEIPEDIPAVAIPSEAVKDHGVWLPRLLSETGMAASNAEAKRLMTGGGVKVDGVAVTDPDAELSVEDLRGKVLQVGKRRFARLT